ncbi:Ionotropic receptor 663 [Blattella germanica]|nr:Ionotropic receptor 663 [Blattella germanica]
MILTFLIFHLIISVTYSHTLSIQQEQYLVSCVKLITEKYLAAHNTLIVSTPDLQRNIPEFTYDLKTYDHGESFSIEHFVQTVLEESVWPLILFQTSEGFTPESTAVKYTYHGYLIITWPDETGDILGNLIQQLTKLSDVKYLNTRGRFLLLIFIENNLVSETALYISQEIFKTFLIFDSLILISNFNEIINVSQLEDKVFFYTWLPYISKDDVILLYEDSFQKNTCITPDLNLFPVKLPEKFNTDPVIAETYISEPIVKLKGNYTDENGEIRYDFEGPEIYIFKLLMQNLNLTYHFVKPEQNEDIYYQILGLAFNLMQRNTDIAFGGIPIYLESSLILDHTISYYSSGDKWFVPCPKPIPRLERISKIYRWSVWLLMAVVFLLITLVIFLSARYSVDNCNYYHSIQLCFINVWAIVMGVSARMPGAFTLRCLFLMFIWTSYAISTVFQAFFTSYLVDPGLTKQIETIEELIFSGIEFGTNEVKGIAVDEKDWRMKYLSANRKNCSEYKTCLLRVIKEGNFATLRSEFFARHFVETTMPKRLKPLCSIPDTFISHFITFYLAKSSPLLEPFNKLLRRMMEAGLIEYIMQNFMENWRFEIDPNAELEIDDIPGRIFFVFSTEHLSLAFYVLALGYVLGFVSVLFELMLNKM